MITNEYRTQISPVAVRAASENGVKDSRRWERESGQGEPRFWGTEMTSAGRERSLSPAATRPLGRRSEVTRQRERMGTREGRRSTNHLNMGAQKKTVLRNRAEDQYEHGAPERGARAIGAHLGPGTRRGDRELLGDSGKVRERERATHLRAS